MKKYINILIVLFIISSCSDFLNTEPLTSKVNTNFYQTHEDVNQALIGIYSVLNPGTSQMHSFFISELLSDDRFAGGGGVDAAIHAISEFRNFSNDMYLYPWQQNYRGIFRSNMLLESFDQVGIWESELQKNKYHGEALFMRAYYYFDLARMFGTVPLVLETTPQNLPKATPEELFGQIVADLLSAIEKLPDTPYSTDDIGRATKWTAQGMLARVFLYYTGVYNKTEIALPESGTLSKIDVVSNIDYCITNSGHMLVDDYRNLWPYAYADNYDYTIDNNLSWVGEEGNNSENMFSIRFGSFGGSSRNTIVLFFGVRMQNNNPFGYGWGVGPVNPQLWELWEDSDLRKVGSICNVNEENIGYVSSSDQYHESYLWQKKYMPVNIYADSKQQSMFTFLYGTPANNMDCNAQEIVLLRLADVYLMGAELGSSKAQEYLDIVRNRVDLPSVPATLENIKKERRYELAFEGVRYYDLMRWGELEAAYSRMRNIPLENEGKPIEYSAIFRPETKGYLPIPESQVLLSDGVLEQNEGW